MAAQRGCAASRLLVVLVCAVAVTGCTSSSVFSHLRIGAAGRRLQQLLGESTSSHSSSLSSRLHIGAAGRRLMQLVSGRSNSTRSKRPAALSSSQLCLWDPSDSTCNPTLEAWLVASKGGLPSSPYRRAVLMANARDKHCAQYTSSAACGKDWQMRCFWQGAANATNGRCASSDLEELLLWSGKGFPTNISIIPAAMTCPGTPSYSFFQCFAYSGKLDGCSNSPNCVLLQSLGSLRGVCVPQAMQQQKLGELRSVFADLDGLSTAGFGSCASACWLRQAAACSNATTKQACSAMPYCQYDEEAARKAASSRLIQMWDDDSSDNEMDSDTDMPQVGSRMVSAKLLKARACRRKAQEFSPRSLVDQTARAVYEQCNLAKSAQACAAVTRNDTAMGVKPQVVDWKSYVPPGKSVQCKF